MIIDEKHSINMEGLGDININDSEKKGLNEDLLNVPKRYSVNKKNSSCSNFWASIFPCFKKVDTTSRRIVYFNNPALNITNWSNK